MQKYMQKKRIFPACLFLMFVLMILVIGKETDMTGQRGNSENPESERWMVLSERRGKNRSDSSDNTSGRSGNSTGII